MVILLYTIIVLKYGGDSVQGSKCSSILFSFYIILCITIYLLVETDKYLHIICTQIKQIFNLTRLRTLWICHALVLRF